jgi:uncharacterized LabA/DUF88 family protein
MKKTAILIDAEWFRIGLQKVLGNRLGHAGVTADILYRNALLALDSSEEELYRVFYYDCPPYQGRETNPISQVAVDFSAQAKFRARTTFMNEIAKKDFVAMRLGVVRARGWTLNERWVKTTINQQAVVPQSPQAQDVYFSLEQKGVDMRLGIDVATLALKQQVERIIVISGDTDMIPAIKLARREGVQVALVALQNGAGVNKHLIEDSDLVRTIAPIV